MSICVKDYVNPRQLLIKKIHQLICIHNGSFPCISAIPRKQKKSGRKVDKLMFKNFSSQ